jgi:hypothetical protein
MTRKVIKHLGRKTTPFTWGEVQKSPILRNLRWTTMNIFSCFLLILHVLNEFSPSASSRLVSCCISQLALGRSLKVSSRRSLHLSYWLVKRRSSKCSISHWYEPDTSQVLSRYQMIILIQVNSKQIRHVITKKSITFKLLSWRKNFFHTTKTWNDGRKLLERMIIAITKTVITFFNRNEMKKRLFFPLYWTTIL